MCNHCDSPSFIGYNVQSTASPSISQSSPPGTNLSSCQKSSEYVDVTLFHFYRFAFLKIKISLNFLSALSIVAAVIQTLDANIVVQIFLLDMIHQ